MSNEVDFFVAGGTLRTSAPSYVTRPADVELLQHLQAGEFCYVLTPRQMGKSSLMVRTAQRLRAEGVRVVIIDLTSIGASSSAISADQWYLGLLSRMRSDLRLTTGVQDWWQEHSAFSVSQRFIDFLQQVVLTECADKVVILIDEIDSTLNLPFRDDFFAAIRALYNERAHNPIYSRLTFALFGVATPTDLIQDRERTPFNVGQRIDLREFTLADAEPLRQGLASRLPEQANVIFQRIFYWTNGHPYLTQKLCHAVVLHTGEWREERIDQAVDQLVNTTFLSEEGRKDPNLTFVQDRILTSPEQERRQMLRLYRRVRSGERVADDDRSLIQNRLELYGLLGIAQGMLQVRNRIYEQVFTSVWVDSVMPTNRRQRNAWLAATIALLLVVGMSAFLFLQPDSTCSELQAQFEANTANSSIRLSALGGLFERVNTCGSLGIDLFYSLTPEEQSSLFVGLSNPVTERSQLVTVIDGIYRTLDTVPSHDQALMKIWLNILRNAELAENDVLVASISNWKEGRQAFQNNNFQQAINSYEKAITAIGNENYPVLHYDLALALIETQEFTRALAELDKIVSMAPELFAPYTPTPEMTLTPIMSPLESPENKPSVTDPTSNSVPTTARATTVLISPLSTAATKIVTPEIVPSTTSETILIQNYQQRFRTAENLYSTVEQTIEGNLSLSDYLRMNADKYLALANLLGYHSGVELVAVNNGPAIIGNQVTFTAVVLSGPQELTFYWDFGDDTTDNGRVVQHSYTQAGTFKATVIASNGGHDSQVETYVVITEAPTGSSVAVPIEGLMATSNSPTTAGNPVDFVATIQQGTNVTYKWDFGDGATETGGSSIRHVYQLPGDYMVRVTAQNRVSTVMYDFMAWIFDAPPRGLIVTRSSESNINIVSKFTATIESGTNTQFEWVVSDGTIWNEPNTGPLGRTSTYTHIFREAKQYTVTVYARNSLGQISASATVVVQDDLPSTISVVNPTPIPTEQYGYNFELDTQNWTISEGEFKPITLTTTTQFVYSGDRAFQFNPNLRSDSSEVYRHTEAVTYFTNAIPDGFNTPGPYNLTGKTVSCFVYLPSALTPEGNPQAYIRLFVKDKDFRNQFSNAVNITSSNVNPWFQLILTVGSGGNMDSGFNSIAINALGIRIELHSGATLIYTGPLYVDHCAIQQ